MASSAVTIGTLNSKHFAGDIAQASDRRRFAVWCKQSDPLKGAPELVALAFGHAK
jgi:hypothetical protein